MDIYELCMIFEHKTAILNQAISIYHVNKIFFSYMNQARREHDVVAIQLTILCWMRQLRYTVSFVRQRYRVFPSWHFSRRRKPSSLRRRRKGGDKAEVVEDRYIGEKKRDTATRARRKELRNVSRQIGRGVGKGNGARGGRLSTAAPTSNKHARTSNFEY